MPVDDQSPEGEFIPDHDISRDQNYSQFYADIGLAVRSPRNLEVSFLKIESIPFTCSVEEGRDVPRAFTFKPSITEIGRASLAMPAAYSLAMDMLGELSLNGAITPKGFRERIEKLMVKIEKSYAERQKKVK